MTYEPNIIAYLCTWCSYTGADTAGIARLKSPANIRAIRVPCSGRVAPELVMRTFDQGADGVLVLGCHIGECHYDSGNHRTAKRLPVLKALMSYAGLEPERLRLDWVSASEGERFARIVNEFTDAVRTLGPVSWRQTEPYSPLSVPILKPASMRKEKADGSTNQDLTPSIQEKARELLASGQVGCVIGYEVGPRGRTRPALIYQAEQAERLVWNQDCTHNLTVYLNQKLKAPKPDASVQPVAIVTKPCDSRAINVMLAEKRFAREQVHVIGVACDGIRQGAGFNADGDGELQERCITCDQSAPIIYDTLVGQPRQMEQTAELSHPAVAELEGMTPAERMDYWLSQFDRCIRCYACRQACPMCDCPTCLYERDDSLWVGMGTGVNEKRAFHLGRAYHLAGRCIGCDECERVCPMDIPISLLNRKLAQEMDSLYGHKAGREAIPTPFVTVLSGEEGLK
jgi:coenzyme F420-reducing hydrogenase delta subunit/ferredoxin